MYCIFDCIFFCVGSIGVLVDDVDKCFFRGVFWVNKIKFVVVDDVVIG